MYAILRTDKGGAKKAGAGSPAWRHRALATPRSVGDGSATRRAYGGRIDGGSDG